MDHLLDGAFARTLRADEHIEALRAHIRAFAETERQTIVAQIQADNADVLEHYTVKDPPTIISIVLGETIYNMRAALDYLIYALAWADSGIRQSGTQFPIFDRPEDFRRHVGTYLRGLNDSHIATIEELQPYKGRDTMKLIRDLSNPDKHRHLLATCGTSFGLVGIWTDAATSSGEDYIHPDVTLDDGTIIVPTLKRLLSDVMIIIQSF